jgi:PAS domain S-box-containing protein
MLETTLPDKVDILIVDDRPENLLALEGILRSLNQNLVKASSGAEALKYLLNNEVAVILMDIEMPDMDGFQTATLIRERDCSSHTPIIFLTAISKSTTHITQAYSLGAVDYMFKPFVPEILKSKVSAFVDLYRSSHQIRKQTLLLEEANDQIQQKNAELAGERDFVSAILDTVSSLVLVLDSEGRILRVNHAWERMTAYSLAEVRGKPLWKFMNGSSDRENGKAFFRETRNGVECEDLWLAKDGTARLVSWCCTRLAGISHTQEYLVVTGTDVTERRRLEEERNQLSREQNARAEIEKLNQQLEAKVHERTEELEGFTYSVSHDMRAPVRAIDGFTRILMEEYSEVLGEEGRRLLSIVRSNTQKMGELIDGLLALSRLGREKMKLGEVDMNELAQTAFQEQRAAVSGDRNITLKVDSLLPAYGDKRLLTQVFQNLFSNALKFTKGRDETFIEVGSDRKDDETVYFVRDNGVGFDMTYADKLFGTFQRLHGADEFEGTGIGLATVQRIIQRHGGRVSAEAKPGIGATFYFSLPVREQRKAS